MTNETFLTRIANEKDTADVKPVPEGYSVFECEGKRYAYKSLGVGSWKSECAGLELMKVLKGYFISSGKMEEGGFWPASSCDFAWTSDVDSYGYRIELDSDGGTVGISDDDFDNACFAVLPLDSERKNF